MSKGKVVLLDMDGTITPARGKVTSEMIVSLMDLGRRAKIGIVSGSNLDYIMEQCGDAIIRYGFANHVDLLPCNGTKVYKFIDGEYQEVYNASMREELGDKQYRRTLQVIMELQARAITRFNIPIAGHFISCRGSTLNWCPIGRSASKEEREEFVSLRYKDSIRKTLIKELKIALGRHSEKLEIVLGGQTSIDVYPSGWDKTFALKHYDDYEVWFVGDKCERGQNDFHIYHLLNKIDRAFKTTGPTATKRIIDKLVLKFAEHGGVVFMPSNVLLLMQESKEYLAALDKKPWWQKIFDNLRARWYKFIGG